MVDRRIDVVEEKVESIEQTLALISSAFPKDREGEPDYHGHRYYHDSIIEAKKAEAAFWRSLRQEIMKKGIITLIIILLGLVTLGATSKLHSLVLGMTLGK